MPQAKFELELAGGHWIGEIEAVHNHTGRRIVVKAATFTEACQRAAAFLIERELPAALLAPPDKPSRNEPVPLDRAQSQDRPEPPQKADEPTAGEAARQEAAVDAAARENQRAPKKK